MTKPPVYRLALLLILAMITDGLLPATALGTAPLAGELGARDRSVVWYRGMPVTLVDRQRGTWQCLASSPESLAFGLGYLAATQDPEALEVIRRQADGSELLSGLSAPDMAELRSSLATWPARRLDLLDSLAAGLNRADAARRGEASWSRETVALLALQQPVLQAAGGWEAAAGRAPVVVRLGGLAKDAPWGRATARWVSTLFPWLAVDVSGPAADHGDMDGGAAPEALAEVPSYFAWVRVDLREGRLFFLGRDDRWQEAELAQSRQKEPPTTPDRSGLRYWQTDLGPLVWIDEAGSLGLVYRVPSLTERLKVLARQLHQLAGGVQPQS